MPNATYEICVDWDNDGDFADALDDITSDVLTSGGLGINWTRGREKRLGTTQAGTLEFSVVNATGKYSPENVAGDLYGKLVPGRPVRLRASYNGTTYDLWYGFICRITPYPWHNKKNCYFYCVDGMEWLGVGKKPMPNISTQISTSLVVSPLARPLVRTSTGNLYCIYVKQFEGVNHVYVARSSNNGVSWDAGVRISAASGVTNSAFYALAVDSSNNLHAVWSGSDATYVASQIWYAKFNGTSWSTPLRISIAAGQDSYDQDEPTVCVDSLNNVHVTWYGKATASPNYYVIWYTKFTTSWSIPIDVSGIAGDHQYASVLTPDGGNNLHLVWQGKDEPTYTNSQIWYKKYNGGWSAATRLSNASGMSSVENASPTIAVDSQGYIHVLFHSRVGTYAQIYYTKYTTSWSTPFQISTASGMSSYHQYNPTVAIDSDDYVHVIWRGKMTGYTDDDKLCYAKYETAWSAPIVIARYGRNRNPYFRWSYYNKNNGSLDWIWQKGTSSPYSLLFEKESKITV